MAEDFLDILTAGLEEMGIEPEKEILNKYAFYQRELRNWSKAYNITGLKDNRDMAIRLFLDSLLYLKVFTDPSQVSTKHLRILDVGSGGGFPGVVLKIARPELSISLMEPSWKKAGFLRHICNKLHLADITVIQSTLQEHVKSSGEKACDIIVTRALFRTYDFIKKTEGILSRGSVLILSKGPTYRKEIKEAQTRLGSRIKDFNIETLALKLPLTGIERYFIKVTLA
ncbi:MAG TPA: 16S rRNA (guanine(527)-N(7))-methyltransferase RsmG [Nitrospirae bacterium]|nr:16S rRNA (guanine(527)-N(7))-methyltransferase RsmG [Nitrospirota bacterium]